MARNTQTNRIPPLTRTCCHKLFLDDQPAIGSATDSHHSTSFRSLRDSLRFKGIKRVEVELVFTHQDMRMLASQQRNDPDDISSYHLFEADRAIGLYFGLRKQAIDEARSTLSSVKPRAAAAE